MFRRKESTEPQILCCPGELAEHWGKAGREFLASTFSVPGKQKCSHRFARIAFVQKTVTLVQFRTKESREPQILCCPGELAEHWGKAGREFPASTFSVSGKENCSHLLHRTAFLQGTLTLVQDERKHRAPDLLLPWRACRALGKGRQRIPC